MEKHIPFLISIFGENGLVSGDEVSSHSGDWQNQTNVQAFAIAKPKNTQEVSQALKYCNENNIEVVPAGGLTGLVHGIDAKPNQLQISFARMNNIIEIDKIGRTMIVEAGAILENVQTAANEAGLSFNVDLGARGSCTIGGNISTNAGGNQVLRFGMMRENILGLEAVLADGTIISSMNRLLKNNAGYDLKQLFIGTEGTLGLVTKAVLRLHPITTSRNTALLALNNFEKVQEVFKILGGQFGGQLTSFEVMWNDFYELIAVQSGNHTPPIKPDFPIYVIVETQGFDETKDNEHFNEVFEILADKGLFEDAIIAQSYAQMETIWAIRDDIIALLDLTKPSITFDVSLSIKDMESYIENIRKNIAIEIGDDANLYWFGHIGDGNLHLVVSPKTWNDDINYKIKNIVYYALNEFEGSISAEHGVGFEKIDYLNISRTENEINLMRTLKRALDPKNILNPNKIFSIL